MCNKKFTAQGTLNKDVLIATGSSKQLMDIINTNDPMECSHTSVPTQVVMHPSSFHLDLKHMRENTPEKVFSHACTIVGSIQQIGL